MRFNYTIPHCCEFIPLTKCSFADVFHTCHLRQKPFIFNQWRSVNVFFPECRAACNRMKMTCNFSYLSWVEP